MRPVGGSYLHGMGVKKDAQEALRWFQLAAKAGDTEALNEIGVFYHATDGDVNQDYKEACNWFKKAAEKGSAEGMSNIGYCYCAGLGVSQNYAAANLLCP